jgi:hypothetical protein
MSNTLLLVHSVQSVMYSTAAVSTVERSVTAE